MLHLQPKPEIQLGPRISPFSTQHSAVYDVKKSCSYLHFIQFLNTPFINYSKVCVQNRASMPTKSSCGPWTIHGKKSVCFRVKNAVWSFLVSEGNGLKTTSCPMAHMFECFLWNDQNPKKCAYVNTRNAILGELTKVLFLCPGVASMDGLWQCLASRSSQFLLRFLKSGSL